MAEHTPATMPNTAPEDVPVPITIVFVDQIDQDFSPLQTARVTRNEIAQGKSVKRCMDCHRWFCLDRQPAVYAVDGVDAIGVCERCVIDRLMTDDRKAQLVADLEAAARKQIEAGQPTKAR